MDLVIAAYVRTVAKYPQFNRFIMNKKIYARNHIAISLAILKMTEGDKIQETTIKVKIPPQARSRMCMIFSPRPSKKTAALYGKPYGQGRNAAAARAMADDGDRLACALCRPLWLHAQSASRGQPIPHEHVHYQHGLARHALRLPSHLQFRHHQRLHRAWGALSANPSPLAQGGVRFTRIIPLGVVIDERIACGAEYSRAFHLHARFAT